MKLEVEIEGIRPLLMHSPKTMFEDTKTRKKGSGYSAEEDAEDAAYRDSEGYLIIPAPNVFACMIKAAKMFKSGRRTGVSITDAVRASITIEPDEIRLFNGRELKDYEIHKALVVVQRARIVRARPLVKEWKAKFSVVWNPALYGLTPATVKEILAQMGYVGLLDWRPQFGIFKVIKVEESE